MSSSASPRCRDLQHLKHLTAPIPSNSVLAPFTPWDPFLLGLKPDHSGYLLVPRQLFPRLHRNHPPPPPPP
eukprot:CAMPEP_0184734014 /NCGR_PEP_ID=MMETSP0314-20130426/59201_1 /TAXON_ID=38298 /ORGANISM="Rhodella maculata, Strain CCMP 736" /LENGTH=70 /DNA_ID=CAMNT_0027200905 /DNA_START=56 /DNA_END=265 /DNA_ORIENTATION=+